MSHATSDPSRTPETGGSHRRRPLRAEAGLIALILIWGVNFSVIKVGLSEIPPYAFNALRFPVAALLFYLVLRRRGPVPLPRRSDWPAILLLTVLAHPLYQLCFINGIDRTTAGNASLLLAGTPIITALLSAGVGHERVGLRRWVGVTAAVGGMVIVVLTGPAEVRIGRATLAGDLLMIGASVVWSAYTVTARDSVARLGAIRVTAWTQWLGTLVIVAMGVPELLALPWGSVSALAWISVLYAGALGIGTAYLLWNYGVRHLGNTRTASQLNLVPVVALVVAWLWLGEVPALGQIAGAAIIIGGVSLTRRRQGPAPGA